MISRSRTAIWALLAVAGGIACGGGDGGTSPPPSGRRTVLVVNNEFQPGTVTIEAGDTILWSWGSNSIDHNIISIYTPTFLDKGNDVPIGGGTTGTDYFNAPASHQVIFPTVGRYWYFCSTHGNTDTTSLAMKGRVIVN